MGPPHPRRRVTAGQQGNGSSFLTPDPPTRIGDTAHPYDHMARHDQVAGTVNSKERYP